MKIKHEYSMHLDCILSMSFMQLRPFLNNRFFSAETVNLTPTVSLLKRHGVFFVELRYSLNMRVSMGLTVSLKTSKFQPCGVKIDKF